MSPTQYDRLAAKIDDMRDDFKTHNDTLLPAVVEVIKDLLAKRPCLQSVKLKKLESDNQELKERVANLEKLVKK